LHRRNHRLQLLAEALSSEELRAVAPEKITMVVSYWLVPEMMMQVTYDDAR
jgi:hypothetical protein